MIGQGITHANFSVDDLEKAKDFYVNKLGFKVKTEMQGMMILETGSGTLVGVYHKSDHQPWNSTVMGIKVEDIQKEIDELTANGISIEMLEGTDENGIMSDPEMGKAAWLKDPAGNWLCLEQY